MSNFLKNETTKKSTTDKKIRQSSRDKRNTFPNDDEAKESKKKKILSTATADHKDKTVTSLSSTNKREIGISKLKNTPSISLVPHIKKISDNKINKPQRVKGRREEERAASVTKTKYFPSHKDIIHRVVKEEKMKKETKAVEDEKRNVTVKRQEEKSDRPRTATLKQASVSQLTKNLPSTSSKEEQVNYEDDFDSYESDFELEEENTDNSANKSSSSISESTGNVTENDNSAVDNDYEINFVPVNYHRPTSYINKEHKLDSGNFDLQDSIAKTNDIKPTHEQISPVPPPNSSLSDEGYDEDKSILKKSPGYYDFERTRIEEQKRLKYNKKRRGEEIQTMIKFNKCYFTTFEMIPVPYEQFIQIHGQTMGIQCAIQTAASFVVNESVQTDETVSETKWTQIPAVFSIKQLSEQQQPNWEHYKQEFLGVGSDSKVKQILEETPYRPEKHINAVKNSATLILSLLNSESNKNYYCYSKNSSSVTRENESFSAASTKICTKDLDILHETYAIDLCMSNSNNFLTIHLPIDNKMFTKASYISIWNAYSLEQPLALLRTLGHPTSVSFGHNHINYIFVGFKDGTLSLWDTNNESTNEKYRLISSPSFKTKINESHLTTVTSVRCISNNESENGNIEEKVCSLDEDGLVIFWTTITKKHPTLKMSLVQNSQLPLKTMCSNPHYCMEFKKLYFNSLDSKHLFVSNNSDKLLHFYSSGSKVYPKYYKTDELSIVTSMDCCPFSSTYFIVGYENGKVALFSRSVQRPLMILSNDGNGKRASIDTIQWSNEKPCIFYAKDAKNVLHVWNLALSDIFPIYSIPFKENVVSIKLTTPQKRQKIYMIIATREGQISVHFLNNDHKSLTNEEYDTDVKYFLNYVKRL